MLTGVKDIDTIILNKLEDQDLVMVCKVNKLADRLCKDQTFWLNRILFKFPYLSMDILNKYKGDRSWSEYYIDDLRKINNKNANQALINGSIKGRLDYVIIALKMGVNIHAPIRYASEFGHIDVVRYLVEAGVDIHSDNDIAIRAASIGGYINTVKYLAEAGANIHALDDASIRLASFKGHIDIVKYLTEAGANIHANNDEAVIWANGNKHNDVVDYLVSLGAPDPRI